MLTIHLLGKPTCHKETKSPILFRTPREELIFCYLVRVRQAISHTKIAALFWPELPLAQGLTTWHETTVSLRAQIGDYLKITPKQVAFDRNQEHWVDLYELDYLLTNDNFPASQKLERMQTLYQGEFLAELEVTAGSEFEKWRDQQRSALKQQLSQALQTLSERFLQRAEFSQGLRTTHWWLGLEPRNETAHRLRMQLFWNSNQRAAALLQYNILSNVLQQEQDAEPDAKTTALFLRILHEESHVANDRPRQAKVSFPATTHNLPRRFSSFIGREHESEALVHYLLEEKHSLVSIVGEGGVGKTRLALAVGQKLIVNPTTPYVDGVWFVSCAGIDAGYTAQEQLAINIGVTIGLRFQGAKSATEQLTTHLANRAMLLILDSFEHLLANLSFVVSLLQQARKLQFLITSRHALPLQSDYSLRLDGLESPPFAQNEISHKLNEDELFQLLATPSVQILRERAKTAWSAFTIDRQNGVAAAKLCTLLDGNPLALELAATLTNSYDLATLFAELTHNYTLLAADLQDLPPRQRSIHNTIDYSWRMLPPELATLMAQCSTFRGNFQHEAVAAITNASLRSTTQLIHRSLLHKGEQHNLYVHEMVRQFAAKKLAQNPSLQLTTNQKHSEYYLGKLNAWWNETESKHIVAQLLPQIDNIYAAWDWAFHHRHVDLFSQSIIAFTQFHIYTGLFWDVQMRTEAFLQQLQDQATSEPEIGDDLSNKKIETALTFASGTFHYFLGNHNKATERLRAAQEQIYAHGWLYLASNLERMFGNIALKTDRLIDAEEHFQQSLFHAQQQRQPYSEIPALLNLGFTNNQLGHTEEGAVYLQQAFDLLQRYPDVAQEAQYYSVYSELHHAQGRWSDSLQHMIKGAEISAKQKKPIYDYHSIGKLLWQSGRFEQSKEYMERVIGKGRNEPYHYGSFWHTIWLIDFANLYVAWQQPEQALFYSNLARDSASQLGRKVLFARARKAEGAAQMQLEQWDEAKESLTEALTLFQQESTTDHECTALTQLIYLHLAQEDEEEITLYAEQIWQLLNSGKLDMTNVEPIKAWWACYLAFRALGDSRADYALRIAYETFQTQLSHIHDETWRNDFSSNIPEHRDLLIAAREFLT